MAYAQNVLGWAAAYATGVEPMNLPAITGPVPAIGDAHLEASQGLGPGMPMSAAGLPDNDPLAQLSLLNPANAGGTARGPLPGPASMLPGQVPCEVICLGSQAPLPAAAEPLAPAGPPLPPWMMPPPAPMPLAPPAAPEIAPPPFGAPAEPMPPAPAEAPAPPTYGALPGPA